MPPLNDVESRPAPEAGAAKIPAYPYYNVKKCLEVATAVKAAGGNRVPVSKNMLAHALKIGVASPMFSQVIASTKVFGMIEGRGTYQLTDAAKRYFFPQSEADRRLAELAFFANPAAFKRVIDRFDGNLLPVSSSLANILLTYGVPESWKDRAAGIFVSAAEQFRVLDASRYLRYSVVAEQARLPESQPESQVEKETEEHETPEKPKFKARADVEPSRRAVVDPEIVEVSNLNRWVFTEAGATVKVETPNPLPVPLWQRLVRYVEMLEPAGKPEEGDAP
jgi:hypothetical protein